MSRATRDHQHIVTRNAEIIVYSIVSTTGVSSTHLDGTAYKLRQASDIEDSYRGQAVAVRGGGGVLSVRLNNEKGVFLDLRSRTVGLELLVNISGAEIRMRR